MLFRKITSFLHFNFSFCEVQFNNTLYFSFCQDIFSHFEKFF
nr:MAG TPA: hypothetical protein [Caudoviricetes sp.]